MGTGVVAAGGTAAAAAGNQPVARRWLHKAGLIDGPDARPPDVVAEVERFTLRSAHMPEAVGWAMYAPPDPQALILCLHGRGGTHRLAFNQIAVHRFVLGAGLPWAVVAVDGGSSSYWHRRADGRDPQTMIFEELLPMVEERTGALPLFLLGWSMGGYGALLAATDRPDRVAAVAASSPAVWRSFRDAAAGAFDDEDDFRRHDLFDRAGLLRGERLRLDCGRDDPFIGTVRSLAGEVPSATSHFGAGFHDSGTWRSFLSGQLAFFEALAR